MDPEETERTVKQVDPDGQTETDLMAAKTVPSGLRSEALAKPFLSDSKFQPGDTVGDNYIIIDLIGVGGMGYVYKVRHRILNKIYAMKTIDSEQMSEMAWRRLQVEAQAIARINHPNIVFIHNFGMHNGTVPYYVMDFLEGSNLAQFLKRSKRLTLEQSLPIFIEICDGLGFAHKKGIVHRDIKPGNIVILDEVDVNGATVKIVDFGIAKLAGTIDPNNQKLTNAGEVFGSPLYMSPEQCEGKRIDARSDIYSLGCTFFEILTGKTPFRGENKVATMLLPSQADPPTLKQASGIDFPDSIEHLIATMLAKAPMNRYPNLERVGSDLEKILAGEEISTSPFANKVNLNRDGNYEDVIDEEEEIQIVQSSQLKQKTFAITGSILILGAIAAVAAGVQIYEAKKAEKAAKARIIKPGSAAAVEKAVKNLQKNETTATSPIVAQQNSTADNPHPAFYSTIFNDGQSIQFDFPIDQSLGQIGNYYMNKRMDAKGKTILKIKGRVSLYANEFLCAHPSLLDLFRPTDLWAFTTPEVIGSENDCKVLMPHLARLTGLQALHLKGSKADNSIIPFLEKLPNLVILNVGTTDVTGSALAKYSGLKNLNELYFGYNKEVPALLLALKGSEKLERLALDNPSDTFTMEHAKLLADCKNLEIINLEASRLDDETLEFLCKLPKLKKIDVSNCAISRETIKRIHATYPGRKLKIEMRSMIQDANAFGGESPVDWLK